MSRMSKVSCFFFVPVLPNFNQNSIASQTHIIHIVPFFSYVCALSHVLSQYYN